MKNHVDRSGFHRVAAFALLTALIMLLHGCVGEEETNPEDDVFGHEDNVFQAVDNWYVNEWWSANAAYSGGSAIAGHSTAVWLRRVGDVGPVQAGEIPDIPNLADGAWPNEGFGLREHLLAAQAQGNALIQLVLFNLPGRDCMPDIVEGERPASELPASELGMRAYETHFIDRVARILEEFPAIPVAVIVEPQSLPHLVLKRDPECSALVDQRIQGYVHAIRYAINRMSTLENVHVYLDAGSSALFGWDMDFALASLFMHGVIDGFNGTEVQIDRLLGQAATEQIPSRDYPWLVQIFAELAVESAEISPPPGYGRIDGFVTNLAGYVPLEEPYLDNPRLPESGPPLMSATFYDWNPRFDEWTYSRDWLEALRTYGSDTDHLGMLIDTSRNGWGQVDRSLEPVPTQDPERVDELRLDRRLHRGNWCNQAAGLGPRPKAQPDGKPWIDAYIWAKPPGESDGPAEELSGGNEPYFYHNPWCVPDEPVERSSPSTGDVTEVLTGALPNGPFTGRWFQTGFLALLENAWPPLCEGRGDVCE